MLTEHHGLSRLPAQGGDQIPHAVCMGGPPHILPQNDPGLPRVQKAPP